MDRGRDGRKSREGRGRERDEFLWHPQPLTNTDTCNTEDHTVRHHSQHGTNGSDGPFVVSNPNTGERTHSLSKRTHSFSLLAVSTPKPLPNGQGRSLIPKLDEAVPAARRNLTLETRERVRVRVRVCVYDVMCAEGEGRMHAGGGCIHVFMYV
jgi:hypothetical protein